MTQFKFKCQKHPLSQILFVCLSSNCSEKRKCCVSCVDESHQGHEIVSIGKFLQQINKNIQKHNNHPEKQQVRSLINQAKQTMKQNLQQLKYRFNNSVNKIQTKLNQKLDLILEVLTYSDEQTVINHIFKTFQSTDLVINGYLRDAQKAKSIEIGSQEQISRLIEVQCPIIYQQIYRAGEQVIKIINKLDQFASDLKFTSKKYDKDFVFSQNNKAVAIEIDDSRNTISKLISPINHTVCCLDKPLDPINDKFFVKINQNTSKKIWLGVCILDIVRKKNFVQCSGIGKGTYAIDQSSAIAYSYNNPHNYATFSNHFLPNYNIAGTSITQTAGWNFKQGDIIMVQIHYWDDEIGFYKINKNYDSQNGPQNEENQIALNQYRMPIDLKTGQFYPFVGLNGIATDQVRILSINQVLDLVKPFGNSWAQFNSFQIQGLDELQIVD